MQQVRRLDPSLNLAALGYSIPVDHAQFAENLGAIAVNPSLELIDQAYVDDAHARGLKVYVYTVNEPEDLQAMVELGVDGVFTNYPERVLEHYVQPEMNKGWAS